MEMQKDDTPTQSPTVSKTPKNPDAMSFYDALKEVEQGARATKLEWNNSEIFIFIVGEKLMIRLEDGKYHPLIVSLADMQGEDWVVTYKA